MNSWRGDSGRLTPIVESLRLQLLLGCLMTLRVCLYHMYRRIGPGDSATLRHSLVALSSRGSHAEAEGLTFASWATTLFCQLKLAAG